VVGEIETENKVLVIKRITITVHLSADEEDREDVERVLEVYEDDCPVARSIRGSIAVISNLDLTIR
jgi:organic hydroperoxide reductase OsmC/OhrA